jgi:hypothetical protein
MMAAVMWLDTPMESPIDTTADTKVLQRPAEEIAVLQ